jgi:prevent-host-death family protein
VKPNVWQLQEAKNRLSEVVNQELQEGPQHVTRRGEEVVVILSREEYQSLVASQTSLVDFFRKSPLRGNKLDLERDKSPVRDVPL